MMDSSTSMPTPRLPITQSLPSTIDSEIAAEAFQRQRTLLLNLTRHCLPEVANSLQAKGIIPSSVCEEACNQFVSKNQRCVDLLQCVQDKIMSKSSNFIDFINVLETEPFLEDVATELVLSYNAISSNSAVKCMSTVSPAISHYQTYLKTVYKNSPVTPENKWPPTPSMKYVKLAMVKKDQVCREDYIHHVLQGSVDHLLENREEISLENILQLEERTKLVLIEGAPGIGKSSLAWELCRKWEELPCMKQYSLVVLLRLREEEVQKISCVSELFSSYKSQDKKSLVEEVLKVQGEGVLFVLDGFDELPKDLQRKGYILSLIRGTVLPASTVLVTSRPSATAELLTSCHFDKKIEVLGFTEESVRDYASSVISSPDRLERFMEYISASNNPAINSLMYVPLNAAIVVQIYLESQTDRDNLLPHTMTKLYTKLCHTILNRFLKNTNMIENFESENFEDLPGDLYKQFLTLAEVAFQHLKREELTFHSLAPDFVHFGFLDAVPALYGGGAVSFNFLHLTLQEFFAAYYISSLGTAAVPAPYGGSGVYYFLHLMLQQFFKFAAYYISYFETEGQEVFRQYIHDKRWNVVWRFVAGLTKFEHFESLITTNEIQPYLISRESPILFHLLFEAQSNQYFKSYFKTLQSSIRFDASSLLDVYVLGYCITKHLTGVEVNVTLDKELSPNALELFTRALKDKHVGKIRLLSLKGFAISSDSELLPKLLQTLDALYLSRCDLAGSNLSELIPRMTSLRTFCFSSNTIGEGELLKILKSLLDSTVTALYIGSTLCSYEKNSQHIATLRDLLNQSPTKIDSLQVGETYECNGDNCSVMDLMSYKSSVKYLSLKGHGKAIRRFADNAYLQNLSISIDPNSTGSEVSSVVELITSNRTLHSLRVSSFQIPQTSRDVKAIANSLQKNTTLKTLFLTIYLKHGEKIHHVQNLMRTQYSELCTDKRINWESAWYL